MENANNFDTLRTAHACQDSCAGHASQTKRCVYRPIRQEPEETERRREIGSLSCREGWQSGGGGRLWY